MTPPNRSRSLLRAAIALALAETACAAPAAITPPPPRVEPPPAASAPPIDHAVSPVSAKVDAIFIKYASGKTPGCSVGVFRAGEILYEKGYGYASLAYERENTETTPFWIASLSKQFTATSILLLANEGKLALSDDIRTYVPELPDYGRTITLDHLLHHTSGIRDFIQLLPLAGHGETDVATPDEVLWLITHQRALNFPPGTRFLYSNSGYALLSIVVQRVTGKSLAAFEAERIFAPLGMTETYVTDDHAKILPRMATGYRQIGGHPYVTATRNIDVTGYANVVSTLGDLAKWDANFYDPRVGGEALIKALREPGALADGSPIDYARGLSVDRAHGRPREWHGGWAPGYRTQLTRYPTERLTVAMLCNDASADVEDLTERVAAQWLPDAPKPAVTSVTPPVQPSDPIRADAGYDGMYLDRDGFEVRVFETRAGALTMRTRVHGGDELPLTATAARTFTTAHGAAHYSFAPAKGGIPAAVVRTASDGPPTTYVKVDTPSTVSAADFARYAGRYTSDEIPRDLELVVEESKLVLRPWGGGSAFGSKPCEPLAPDTFTLGARLLTFERGAHGEIASLVVTSECAHGVRFKRLAASKPASASRTGAKAD